MSPIKETNFFSKDIDTNKFDDTYKFKNDHNLDEYFAKEELEEMHIAFVKKQEHYEKLFENHWDDVSWLGEASTSYLWSNVAAKEIKKNLPNAKCIILLRDPIERIYSHWQMDRRWWTTWADFLTAIKEDYKKEWGRGEKHLYVELWMYYEQVKRYLEVFDKENILLINSKSLYEDSKSVLDQIFSFLDIEKNIDINFERKNTGGLPRFPLFMKLINLLRLEKVLKQLFSWRAIDFFKKILTTKAAWIAKNEEHYLSNLYKEDQLKLKEIIE